MFDGTAVREFLERTWGGFRRESRRRKLTAVIEYLVTAERRDQPIEVQLLLVFVCMENLKATFARSSGIPETKRGFHRVSSGRAATMTRQQLERSPKYGFEALLRQMLKDVGMTRGLKRLISLRNQIIHQGLSTWPAKSRFKAYETCHDILREYLLRLLGFKGSYLVYSRASRTTQTI